MISEERVQDLISFVYVFHDPKPFCLFSDLKSGLLNPTEHNMQV